MISLCQSDPAAVFVAMHPQLILILICFHVLVDPVALSAQINHTLLNCFAIRVTIPFIVLLFQLFHFSLVL